MGSDESPTARSNWSLRSFGDLFPGSLGTPSRSRTGRWSLLVSLALVLVLAIGVAAVPAVGAGGSVTADAGSGDTPGVSDGVGVEAGDDRGTASASTAVRTTSSVTDTVGGSATHASTVDVSPTATQGPASTVVAVIEPLSGESIVFLGAYSRYGEGDPLEHPIRSEVDALASRLPGVQFTTVVGSVDASESTVRYHTRVLERENVVQTATVWGTQRLYPAGIDASHFAVLAAIRGDARSAVLRAIDRNDPATVTTIAEAVDRSPSTVSHHLSRLESADLIDRERAGQSVHVSLASGVSELLADDSDASGIGVDSTALELVGD